MAVKPAKKKPITKKNILRRFDEGKKTNAKTKRLLTSDSRIKLKRNRKADEKDVNGLPNSFIFAGEALQTMSQKKGSAGSIIVAKYKSWNYKLIYALTMNTLKNINLIQKVIEELKLESKFSTTDKFLLEILVGDLLFGTGLKSIEQNTTAAQLLSMKEVIEKKKQKYEKSIKSSDDKDPNSAKYLRINHLRANQEHVINQLKALGLKQVEYSKEKIKYKKFVNKFKTIEHNEFMVDFHFPSDLIIFKQASVDKLHKSALISKGKAIIQDKASYMAVAALELTDAEKPNIIDGCCAPGCKTSAIGSVMRNKGKILGFDINKSRIKLADHMLKKQGITCAKLECQDFSKVKVRRLLKNNNIDIFDSILLDPSCSGSGLKRLDYYETKDQMGRLKKLQAFQVSLLKHAILSDASKSIVYCTCSTSIEENEQVVEMALNESKKADLWEVANVLPYWPMRGDESYSFGDKCIRSNDSLLTNGFFIAKLTRKLTTEE